MALGMRHSSVLMYTYISMQAKIGGVMGRKALYVVLFVSLAFAPSVFADVTQVSSDFTSGSQSNTIFFFTVSGFNGGIVNDGVNGGTTFSQVPFSLTLPGINATGNTVALATLDFSSGGSPTATGVSILYCPLIKFPLTVPFLRVLTRHPSSA
jgi:hypothetical protein